MKKDMTIKKIQTSSITFEHGLTSLTIKVNDGSVMDKAIELAGKHVRVSISGGYVIQIEDYETVWMKEQKELSEKE